MDERDYYWRLVNTPGYWQDAARDFVCAANLLKNDYYRSPRLGFARSGRLPRYAAARQRYTSPRSIIVLYALAVENMFKAVIVAQGQDPIGPKGELKRWFATHDLRRLAERARIEGLDARSLEQLSSFVRAGKYPVGLRDGDAQGAHNYFPDSVIASVEELLPVLEDELAGTETKREKRPRMDLLRLCAGRKPQLASQLPTK